MYDAPSPQELLEAVKHFIDETAAPGLSGHSKFHALVASNVLAIVLRELDQRPSAEAGELTRLASLLNQDEARGTDALNADLADKIMAGEMTPDTPGLLLHLKTTAIAQLYIDQPTYSGLDGIDEEPK